MVGRRGWGGLGGLGGVEVEVEERGGAKRKGPRSLAQLPPPDAPGSGGRRAAPRVLTAQRERGRERGRESEGEREEYTHTTRVAPRVLAAHRDREREERRERERRRPAGASH